MTDIAEITGINTYKALMRSGFYHGLRQRRWLLLFGCFFALACAQFLFFGIDSQRTLESGTAQVESLDLQYYDMMLVLVEGQIPLSLEQMPRPIFDRRIAREMLYASLLTLQSDWGSLRILAIPENTMFFQFSEGELNGRLAQSAQEIVLPQSWAEAWHLQLGDVLDLEHRSQRIVRWQPILVGSYRDTCDLPMALTMDLPSELTKQGQQANVLLINSFSAENLNHLSEWMQQVYPGAVQFFNEAPQQLGASMLRRIHNSTQLLPMLFCFFSGIGILSLALLSFMDRRHELAILKTQGLTSRQCVVLIGVEYGFGVLSGVALSVLLIVLVALFSELFSGISLAQLLSFYVQGLIYSMLVTCLALVYPIALAKTATVEQLQYGYSIPLSVRDIDHMEWPTGDLVLRERTENIRFLRVPYDLGRYDCLMLKEAGEGIKKGEAIAVSEYWQGYVVERYISPCDGYIEAINGALVTIRPDGYEVPFHNYPSYLVEDEQRRMELIRRVREEVRRTISFVNEKEEKG